MKRAAQKESRPFILQRLQRKGERVFMKKLNKFLAIGVALCLMLSLAACGKVKISEIGIQPEAKLEKGETLQLELKYGTEKETTEEAIKQLSEWNEYLAFEWKSSDESVATVDEKGLVTAVDAGECEINVEVKIDSRLPVSTRSMVIRHIGDDETTIDGLLTTSKCEVTIDKKHM